MLKFEFSIQIRHGQKLDGIVIMGRDREEAERKLRQMYRYCDVLHCAVKETGGRRRPETAAENA
jgi:hypothetical protein